MSELSEQIAANKRKASTLIAGFVVVAFVVLGAIALLLGGGIIGLVIVALVVGAAAVGWYYNSEKIALSITHAKPADEQLHARLFNLIEGLCIASGIDAPRLYVVGDAAPNAFSTGRDPKHAALVVTTGLLEKLNRMELEGVLAHELSHIRNSDILVTTLTVTPVRVFAPLGTSMRRFAVNPEREFTADAAGAQLTRYPPGLISALEKLKDDDTSLNAAKATAHLWIEEPAEKRAHHISDTHPPLDARIRALQAL